MSMELTARVRLAEDVLMQKVGDDAILLNLKTENYFALDEIGTRIIDTLQESDSVAQADSRNSWRFTKWMKAS